MFFVRTNNLKNVVHREYSHVLEFLRFLSLVFRSDILEMGFLTATKSINSKMIKILNEDDKADAILFCQDDKKFFILSANLTKVVMNMIKKIFLVFCLIEIL